MGGLRPERASHAGARAVKRGLVCWVNLEPASPPEFGKVRPAIIVSNSDQNAILASVVVIPVSSRPPEIAPLRLRFQLSGLKGSFAVLPGIRQVSKARIDREIGLIEPEDLARIDRALALYLHDAPR